ncbi:hypothetical protein PVAP13_7NG298124 [Panicum virgatum]|uniref:Uncharacterized protein n=1 Tax=Panicum virgatum TaxID=38727 RepID=A0A8T0Q6H0_PANVG|nr:hypothetical protein PVAP13_7NG298124 [Panicum virgatum]
MHSFFAKPPSRPAFTEERERCRRLVRRRLRRVVQGEATSSASAVRTAAARRRRRGSGAHGGNRLAGTAEKAAAVAARGAPRGACGRHGCGPSSGGRRARPHPCISAPSRSLWGSGSLPTAAQAHARSRRGRRDLPTAAEASTALLAHDASPPCSRTGAGAEISPPPPRPPQRCSPTTPPLLALARAPCLYGASGTSNFSFRQRLGLIEIASLTHRHQLSKGAKGGSRDEKLDHADTMKYLKQKLFAKN